MNRGSTKFQSKWCLVHIFLNELGCKQQPLLTLPSVPWFTRGFVLSLKLKDPLSLFFPLCKTNKRLLVQIRMEVRAAENTKTKTNKGKMQGLFGAFCCYSQQKDYCWFLWKVHPGGSRQLHYFSKIELFKISGLSAKKIIIGSCIERNVLTAVMFG